MVTAEIYTGEHGCSMKLDGMENGFNDNVRTRSIVMHGSDYVCKQRAVNGVMMGRSFGCPAVPSAEVGKIINIIKDGSCFYNYYPDETYTRNSKILNADFVWPVIQSLQLALIKIPDSLNSLLPDQVNWINCGVFKQTFLFKLFTIISPPIKKMNNRMLLKLI